MNAIQINAAPGAHHIVVLAADGACQNRALKTSGSERLAASRTSVVVCIQSFFEPAEKNVATADFFPSQSSGRDRVEAKHFFPSDPIGLRFRWMAVAA